MFEGLQTARMKVNYSMEKEDVWAPQLVLYHSFKKKTTNGIDKST